jgi:hypothetical protein
MGARIVRIGPQARDRHRFDGIRPWELLHCISLPLAGFAGGIAHFMRTR